MRTTLPRRAKIEFVVCCSACQAGLKVEVEITQKAATGSDEDYLCLVIEPCRRCARQGYIRGQLDERHGVGKW